MIGLQNQKVANGKLAGNMWCIRANNSHCNFFTYLFTPSPKRRKLKDHKTVVSFQKWYASESSPPLKIIKLRTEVGIYKRKQESKKTKKKHEESDQE